MGQGRVRCSWLGALSAAAILIAAPGGASAATQLGDAVQPNQVCTTDLTHLQTTSPGGSYAAPAAGVITSWSYRANAVAPNVPDRMKLKVARPAGTHTYTIVGESAVAAPLPGLLNTYPAEIPVRPGDLIGFWASGDGTPLCSRGTPGYDASFTLGDIPPGATATFTPAPVAQLSVSATLEPAPACKGQVPTISGTEGDDVLAGTEQTDVIAGLGGNDTISGLGGGDFICGGSDRDTLRGGPGKDSLLGQGGKDRLRGGGAKDFCKGGKGNDSAKCEVERSI